MPKFKIIKHYVSGYEGIFEADSLEEAIEMYDDTPIDELKESYLGSAESNDFEDVYQELE